MKTLPEINDTPEKLALHNQNPPTAGKAAEASLTTACISLCIYPRRLCLPKQAVCTAPPTAAKGSTYVCVTQPTLPHHLYRRQYVVEFHSPKTETMWDGVFTVTHKQHKPCFYV